MSSSSPSSFPVHVPTPDGPVAAVIHLPDRIPAPVVVCSHGLLASKDSAKYLTIGEDFSRIGMAVVRFDYSGCGQTRARLVEGLVASRLRDIQAVLDFAKGQPWCNGTMGIFGSSFGGFIGSIAAARDREHVRAVICWATPFDLKEIRLSPDESENLRSRFPPGFALGTPTNLEGLPSVAGTLVIHGAQDPTVPWKEALKIYHSASDPRKLLLLEKMGHRFDDPSCLRMSLKLSLEWLQSRLNPPSGVIS